MRVIRPRYRVLIFQECEDEKSAFVYIFRTDGCFSLKKKTTKKQDNPLRYLKSNLRLKHSEITGPLFNHRRRLETNLLSVYVSRWFFFSVPERLNRTPDPSLGKAFLALPSVLKTVSFSS